MTGTYFFILKCGNWFLTFFKGSGGTCGDTTGSRYCGQALHVVKDLTTSIPICDCTAPFAVRVVTDDLREAGSDKTANRGTFF